MEVEIKVEIMPSYEWQEDAREAGISHRELEVFALVVKGYKNKEIAEILNIKHQSVKNHLHSFYKKLKVRNGTQALGLAIMKNLIQVEKKVNDFSLTFKAEKTLEIMSDFLSEENTTLKEKEKREIKKYLKSRGIDFEHTSKE